MPKGRPTCPEHFGSFGQTQNALRNSSSTLYTHHLSQRYLGRGVLSKRKFGGKLAGLGSDFVSGQIWNEERGVGVSFVQIVSDLRGSYFPGEIGSVHPDYLYQLLSPVAKRTNRW